MSYESYENILVSVHDRIATVTLNRPERLNANNAKLHSEMSTIFRDLQRDKNVEVIILTGAGRAFSAGGDMDWMQYAIEHPEHFETDTIEQAKQIIFSLLDLQKPIIAKVNGHAVGLGASLALFCDVVFMSENGKIGDTHVAVGLVAADGGAIIWPQLVGYHRAKEFLFTGQLLTAKEAEAIGLINHAVPPEELDKVVDEFAARLRKGPARAIAWTKVAINIGLKQLAHSIMDTALAYESVTNRTPDHQEAVTAFLEKRSPNFTDL